MTTKLTELVEEFARAQKVFQGAASAALKEAFQDFFTRFPTVESLSWPQYAPYFNDGAPCEFSVHEIREIVIGGQEYDIYYGDEDVSEVLPEGAQAAIDELSNLITNSTLEDVMGFTFGRDCEVIATAKGFTTDEYSHD